MLDTSAAAYPKYCADFHARLQAIAKDAAALYRVAGKICTMSKRPTSIDHEDHLHDAVMVALETIREATPTFRYPYDMDPEYWLVRCVRRTFHGKCFYYKEFIWASRRVHGHLNTGYSTGDRMQDPDEALAPAPPERQVAGTFTHCMDTQDMFIDDVCALVPDTIKPLVRLLGQGATTTQAERILKKKRYWAVWRMREVRKRMIDHGMRPEGTIFAADTEVTDE